MAKYMVSIRTSATSLFPPLSLPRTLLPSSHTSIFRPTPSTSFPRPSISGLSPSPTSAFQTSLRILILSIISPNPSPARVIPPQSGFANHLLTPSPTPPPLLSPILRTTRASHLQPPLFLNHKDPGRKPPTRLGAKPALCSTLPQFTFPCADLRCKQSSPALPATSWSNQIQRGRKEAEIHHPVKNRPSSLSPLPLTLSCYPGHVWIPQRSSPPGLRFPFKMVSHSSDSHLTLPPAHPLPLINET